jgi:CrcB protein
VSEHAAGVEPSTPTVTAPIVVAIALGGAVGGYLRVGASLLPGTGSSGSWPWITFAVNIAGAFVLALTVALLRARGRSTSLWRPLVGTGFCGALTTFSTLQIEVFRMLRADHVALALAYLAASVLVGYGAIVAGLAVGRQGAAA